jgi:transposase-like protein
MNELAYRNFFLNPTDAWHRRYEALRACFVEQQPLADVARRFGVSYGTACNWVSQFRSQCDADQRPPFFFNRFGDAPQHCVMLPTRNQTSRSLMSKRCP